MGSCRVKNNCIRKKSAFLIFFLTPRTYTLILSTKRRLLGRSDKELHFSDFIQFSVYFSFPNDIIFCKTLSVGILFRIPNYFSIFRFVKKNIAVDSGTKRERTMVSFVGSSKKSFTFDIFSVFVA